jgi:starch synthase
VFTIHNLSVQGTRPVAQTDSSLKRWFPQLKAPAATIADPRYADCINPLAIAIRLADAVTTVSPSYADEILLPRDDSKGRRGGEGLEQLLAARNREGALTGILNGCDYPRSRRPKPGWKRLVAMIRDELMCWVAGDRFVDSSAWLADRRLAALSGARPAIVATSIGRVTEQKLGLYRQNVSDGTIAIDRALTALDKGILIMLGSGDPDYEDFLRQSMAEHPNLIFLNGYSDRLAEALYAAGDLFLMPSLFEPCGISQMLAMRAGQPCVAHAVGGLRDTVTTATGFPFDGATPRHQAQSFAREIAAAVDLKLEHPGRWRKLVSAAAEARFSWDASAKRYLTEVYAFDAEAN